MRVRQFFSGACALLLMLCSLAAPVCAETETAADPAAETPLYAMPADLALNASSALLVGLGTDPEDDLLLIGKNETTLRSPAALVRLMVGICAMDLIGEQKLDLDKDTGTYHSGCFDLIAGSGVSVLELSLGAKLTLRDLLTASMIQTAGDAVVTLAVALAGSHAAFVQRMNETAQSLGCTQTSFSNVTGLEGGNQYTSCVDLYRIMRRALSYPELKTMMGLTEYTVRPVSGGNPMTLYNTNELIRASSPNYSAECVAGRTGYTSESGRCIVSVAQQNGYEYMAVVLGCPDKNAAGAGGLQYDDSRALYKWAFQNLTYTTLVAKGAVVTRVPVSLSFAADSVTLVAAEDAAAVLPNDLDVQTIRRVVLCNGSEEAPIEKGKVYGKLELYLNLDRKIGEVDLVASEGVERSQALYIWKQVSVFFASPWFYIALGSLLILLFGYMLLNILHNRNRRKNNRRRVRIYK